MLCLHLPNGTTAPIFHKDIFKVLQENSAATSSAMKGLKTSVREALRRGRGVSVEVGLLTGFEERKGGGGGWFGGGSRGAANGGREGWRSVEERYVTHWTCLKDGEGRVRWVVLTIAPKI